MIVGDLYVVTIALTPLETYSELIIDADSVLAFAIPAQRVQFIVWRNPKVS
jgi:hypothetical protein